VRKRWTYARAGVDVRAIRRAQRGIREILEQTFQFRKGKFGEVVTRIGHYAALIDIGDEQMLALHADGVGTKVLIAQLMNRFDTVGIDCVAMNVNDLVCVGAEPVALIDYLVVEKPDQRMIKALMQGLVRGAREAETAIIGGETAVMPDVVRGAVPGKGFDLAALAVGVVYRKQLVTGERLEPGDLLVGLASSGLHSNGYTLVRKVLLEEAGLSVYDRLPELGNRRLGTVLLTPTRIYVKPALTLVKEGVAHMLAHITGGAFSKLRRFEEYARVGFVLNRLPKPQPIFNLVQRLGAVATEEMYRTFNMGVGFVVAIPKDRVREVLSILKQFRVGARVIGYVRREPGVRIEAPTGEQFEL